MLTKIPFLIKKLLPKRIWELPSKEKVLYLTFDDGPIPEVTPWVLEQLKRFDAKATFFCIGDNVKNHPDIFRTVLEAGHTIGNHTHNHLNGWKTSTKEYLQNMVLAEEQIFEHGGDLTKNNRLFRPPYGRMKEKQARLIREKNYRIIMWDVISGDYDAAQSPEKCYTKVIRHARSGSIVIFHDSLKAEKNLREVLPRVLEFYQKQGFQFRSLEATRIPE